MMSLVLVGGKLQHSEQVLEYKKGGKKNRQNIVNHASYQ